MRFAVWARPHQAKKRGGSRAPAHIRVRASRVDLWLDFWGGKRALVIARVVCRSLWRGRRSARLPNALIVAAMLTGCAVGPDFQTPPPPEVTSYLGRLAGLIPGDRVPGQRVVQGADIPGRWWE